MEVFMNRALVFCTTFCLSVSLPIFAQTPSAQAIPAAASAIPATTTVARYAYSLVANEGQKDPAIVTYSVNPQTGYLRPVQSIVPSGVNYGIVADPSDKFLYIPDGPQILGYSIAANGALQALKGSPFALDGGSTMVFYPSGRFVYSNLGTEFSMNTTTGALTLLGNADPTGLHEDIAITPSGSFVYILEGDHTISAFSPDPTTGVLTQITGSPFASGITDELYSDVVSPDGKFLFVTSETAGTSGMTAVLSINATTGALTPAAGSPFTTPGGSCIVDATSQFLYVGGEQLGAYSINSATGALTALPGSPYSLPAPDNAFSLDPTGKFLYASLLATGDTYTGKPSIVTYSINSTTGALTKVNIDGAYGNQVEALAVSTGAKAVVYSPKFAYAANQGTKTISEWTITDSTGALSSVSGSPVADANGPKLVATAPSGAFVYTGNSNNSVSEYSVNATTGVLTLVSGSPITGFGSVNALVVDPTSAYMSVLDSSKNLVDVYTINEKTGALTFLTSVSTSSGSPQILALDPMGIAGVVGGATTIQTWAINSGVLYRAFASVTLANPAAAVAFDQRTQYVFVTEPKTNSVVTYNVIAYNGVLSPLSTAATGNNPGAVLAEPSGKYVYVANTGDGTISAYHLNSATGALTQIGTAVTAAAGTNSLSNSNDGKYLYATNGTAGMISIFKITSTGALTSAGTATTGTSPTSIATTGTHQ
jgi:6-phosphogluconolactonase